MPAPSDTARRALRPSDGLVWAVGALKANASNLAELLGVGLLAVLAAFFVAGWRPVVVAAVLFAAGCGCWQTWRLWSGRLEPTRWVHVRSLFAATLAVSWGGSAALVWAPGWAGRQLVTVLALVAGEAFMRLRAQPGVVLTPWWSHARLSGALVAAEVLAPVRTSVGEASLPTLGYLGRAGRVDEHGITWTTVTLPPGQTWEKVRARHGRVASALGLATDRLHVEHDAQQPASAVTLAVLPGRPAEAPVAVLPERTDWTSPVTVAPDRLGRPVQLRTANVHSVFVGTTGSGKTRLARLFVSHALLDPRVPVVMISGKDDEEDWQPMRPLCDAYVGGTRRADVERALLLLRQLEQVSEARGQLSKRERQPMVIVIDEWFRLCKRAKAYDPALEKDLQSLLGELAATVRSRGMHIVMTFQRGTTTYIDGDLRTNLPQKAVGMTVKDAETRYVLDQVPQVLPGQPGEFLVALDDADPTLVAVPDLDDEAFAAVCKRAGVLREAEPHLPVLPDEQGEVPLPPKVSLVKPPAPPDPLHLAVREALAGGPLTATELFDVLPADRRPGAASVLGRVCAQVPGVVKVWTGERRNRPAWALQEYAGLPSAGPLPPASAPSASLRAVEPAGGISPRQTAAERPAHAQTDGPLALQLVPSAQP